MRKMAWMTALLLISVLAAHGQVQLSEPKDQLFFGYELQHNQVTGDGISTPNFNMNGLTFSNSLSAYRWLGAESDFSIGYKDVEGIRIENYYWLGGPRVSYSFGRFAPYGHFLLGADRVHISGALSITGFALGGGGGATVYLTKHFGFSGGLDYLHASRYGLALNDFRVTAGPVFTFGGSRPVVANSDGQLPHNRQGVETSVAPAVVHATEPVENSASARQSFAEAADRKLRHESAGFAEVVNTTLIVHSINADREHYDALVHDQKFVGELRRRGFTQFIYTNDGDKTFSWGAEARASAKLPYSF